MLTETGQKKDAAIISHGELARIKGAMVIKTENDLIREKAQLERDTELMQTAAKIKKAKMSKMD